mgnify:FL=1
MKILCETTGDFMLMDFSTNQRIPAHRPAVITMTNFFSQRSMLGQLNKFGDVTDEATDEEFAKYVKESDGDITLAIESFLATFGVETPTTKGKGKGKGKDKAKEEAPTE